MAAHWPFVQICDERIGVALVSAQRAMIVGRQLRLQPREIVVECEKFLGPLIAVAADSDSIAQFLRLSNLMASVLGDPVIGENSI